MDNKQLAEMIKHLRSKAIAEQGAGGKEYIKQLSNLPYIGGEKHSATSPNASHIEEEEDTVEEAREVSGQLGSFGGRHSPRKRLSSTSLGNVGERAAAQRTGNQRRTRSTYAEEATQIAIKKVKDKKGEEARGATSTGQKADTLDFTPTKPELTTNH